MRISSEWVDETAAKSKNRNWQELTAQQTWLKSKFDFEKCDNVENERKKEREK